MNKVSVYLPLVKSILSTFILLIVEMEQIKSELKYLIFTVPKYRKLRTSKSTNLQRYAWSEKSMYYSFKDWKHVQFLASG